MRACQVLQMTMYLVTVCLESLEMSVNLIAHSCQQKNCQRKLPIDYFKFGITSGFIMLFQACTDHFEGLLYFAYYAIVDILLVRFLSYCTSTVALTKCYCGLGYSLHHMARSAAEIQGNVRGFHSA